MKNVLSLFSGLTVILIIGFSFVKWQTNQTDSDRVRQIMTTSIQKASTQSEDMSQRTNNSDVKTLRVTSLQNFMDDYFKLYNDGVIKVNEQTPNNTMFNFYLSNAKDLKLPNGTNSDVSHGASVVVLDGKVSSLTYNVMENGKSKSTTVKDATAQTQIPLNIPVDIKMVKVHAQIKNETFDATAALSVKRSPVASPVVNKLEDLTVPYKTRADDSVFLKDLDLRDGVGNKIETSKINFHLEMTDGTQVSPKTELTATEYKAVYEAIDQNSGSKLKVGRKILVDQNLPLIESPEVVTAYVGDSEFTQAKAFEMPNGANGTRGREITDSLTQDLTNSQLGTAGTYTQHLTVTDQYKKTSKLTRTFIVKANTPKIKVSDPVIGTYRTGRMPSTSELMAGVTASSPKDGNITNRITIDISAVNSSKAGTYTVKYTVKTPTGGLTDTATRTIEFQ